MNIVKKPEIASQWNCLNHQELWVSIGSSGWQTNTLRRFSVPFIYYPLWRSIYFYSEQKNVYFITEFNNIYITLIILPHRSCHSKKRQSIVFPKWSIPHIPWFSCLRATSVFNSFKLNIHVKFFKTLFIVLTTTVVALSCGCESSKTAADNDEILRFNRGPN